MGRRQRGRSTQRLAGILRASARALAIGVATPFVIPRFAPQAVSRHSEISEVARVGSGPSRISRKAVASFSTPIRRLDFTDAALVGAGYDLVDVRVLTKDGTPMEATFMLDSGLSTNLVSPSFLEKLGLEAEAEPMEGTALGGNMMKLSSTFLPGLEVLGEDDNETRFAGLWEGAGWRAWCTLDWDAWKAAAAKSKTISGKVQYEVLPSEGMTDRQLEMVGWRGQETVEGELEAGRFMGRGVSVEPKGVLATTESYEFREDGDSLVEVSSGMRLRRTGYRPSLPLPGPLHATSVSFTQEQLAEREGTRLDGMLGQLPLYQDFAVEVNPEAKQLVLRMPEEASVQAQKAGMRRVPGMELPSRLFGVNIFHAGLTGGTKPETAVPAMVDSGSANSVVNWPAAELLFGIRPGDRIVRQAPRIRAIGVGGGYIDMPLLSFSIGLVGDGDSLVPRPVRVAIGDAQVFAEIFGREESGGWFMGIGPKPFKPAGLIGQDLLSQQRHILCASEPALYAVQQSDASGSFRHMGEGDCVDANGRRLAGLQKLGCTTDDAAWECLQLPPGSCGGIAVTPQGAYQGLCYIFVSETVGTDEELNSRGFRRYEAPQGQELAPEGSTVDRADGTKDAQCFKWEAR